MEQTRKERWEDVGITQKELNTIGEALKHEEFRQLLRDYVDEINDPENKRIFEEEITLLEKERGVDCTFVHPGPEYVIKTSVDGERKAYINICANDKVGKPISQPTLKQDGTRGLTWSLPFLQAPPRDDLDNSNKRCTVFDVVFHPDTLRMAESNAKFKTMVNNTALDAVEKNFNVKLDKRNVRLPKMKSKGTPPPTVIRRKSADPCPSSSNSSPELEFPFPYPYKDLNGEEPVRQIEERVASPEAKIAGGGKDGYTVPRYTIKYRDSIDIQDFANDSNAKINAAIPNELILTIFLPMLSSSANVDLDVTEKLVSLKCTKGAKYFLYLPLPYAINEELGNAKFIKTEHKLVLTLPVKRTNKTVADLTREDSGVESDAGIHTPESEEEEVTEDRVQSLIAVVSSSSDNDNSERTNVSVVEENFLNPDIHYSLPSYSCNVVDNTLAFTLHVKNVDPDSMKHRLVGNNGMHMYFSSIGAGFFPIYYAFYIQLPASFTIAENGISVEVWDNNVITQLVLNPCDTILTSYLVGTDQESTTNEELGEPAAIGQKLELVECMNETVDLNVQMNEKSKNKVLIEITRKGKLSLDIKEKPEVLIQEEDDDDIEEEGDNIIEDEDDSNEITEEDTDILVNELKDEPNATAPQIKPVPKKHSQLDVEKARSYSESSSDELNLSPTKRGILKCRTANRSLSESNAEDYCYSSSLDVFQRSFSSDSCIPEEPEESLESKKTVRFNEVISKKTFRINSSILGQKKKNQRKLRNKKRAQERRASESETSEGEFERGRENYKSIKTNGENQITSGSDEKTESNGENEESKTVISQGEKASYSSGSGNEAVNTTDQPEENNCKDEVIPNKKQTATVKRASKRNKNKRIRNPKNYAMQQLDFKNDLIFDLDM